MSSFTATVSLSILKYPHNKYRALTKIVVQNLTDEALAWRLTSGGRSTVENCYNWPMIYQAWETIYDPVLPNPLNFAP